MDVAARFTPQAFQTAFASNNEHSLLKHWRDCPFYTLFVREKSGGEIPAMLKVVEDTHPELKVVDGQYSSDGLLKTVHDAPDFQDDDQEFWYGLKV